MGLITLFFLVIFTLLYLSKSLQNKPQLMTQAVEKITDNLDQVSLWGAIYGLAAAVLTLIMIYSGAEMLIRLASNVLIVLMTLPFVFDRALAKFQEKLNPVIVTESRNLVGWITKQEKYIGYAGAVCSLLLFAILFR